MQPGSELRGATARPTPEQMRERLEGRSRVLGGETSAEAVQAVRASR